MNKNILEERHQPSDEQWRRLNLIMKEVVKNEIIKRLDAVIIFPISNRSWVSLVQCVQKKGGMNIVVNKQKKLTSTRMVMGWRVYINYKNINKATQKDCFPLPSID